MSQFLLKSPLGSQRTRERNETSSEIHDFSLNTDESSCAAGNETGMDLNSSFHVKQAQEFDAPMAAQECASSWSRPYLDAPFVSLGTMSEGSLPSWETTDNRIMNARENGMLGQTGILTGSSSFSLDTYSHMRTEGGVQRELFGSSVNNSSEGAEIPNHDKEDIVRTLPVEPRENCILNRFEAIRRARDSYNCTGNQPLRDREHVSRLYDTSMRMVVSEATHPSGDQSVDMPLHVSENHRNISNTGSRGSSKRKICAVGSSSSGSSSKVSAYTCSYSETSDPLMLGMASSTRHRRNGSISTCLDSILGETSDSMVTPVDGSVIHQVAEPAQHGEWFLSDNSYPYEETSMDSFLRTSTSGEPERRLHTEIVDAGYLSIATEPLVSNPEPPQVHQGAAHSQPDLRISRRIHQEPHRSAYPSNVNFSGFLPSPCQFPEGHGGSSLTNLSSRRENNARLIESHLGSNIYGDRSRQSAINALRGGRSRSTSSSRFPSLSAYELVRPEDLSHVNSSINDSSETFNLVDPPFLAFPATSISPSAVLSEYSTRSRSRIPSSNSRHSTSFVSATSFQPPVPSSASMMDPSPPHSHSNVSAPSERPPSSSRVLRRLMLSRQSLLDVLGERSLLSAAGNVIAFPLQRLGALRSGEDQHHRMLNDAINEQMLMLEATILFGGIGIQDEHSDWRLDVDNMSYEELLALGEQIGDVCTGLSEEVISQKLKTWKYAHHNDIEIISSPQETEVKCCVCQEEYQEEEELGGLVCGHSYHADCIKQWLVHKNLCPVCKATAFS